MDFGKKTYNQALREFVFRSVSRTIGLETGSEILSGRLHRL